MVAFCIHNARKMRTNFSLVYISPCTFKCPIKITRQSSNSCDAGSHRCADETTVRLNSPETRWRTPCRSVGRTSTSLHDVGDAATPPRVTFLSLHSWDQRKPTSRYIIWSNCSPGLPRTTYVIHAEPVRYFVVGGRWG